MLKQYIFVLLFSITLLSCKEDEEVASLAAPSITVSSDTRVYKPGETATISVSIIAPGKIKELSIGTTKVGGVEGEASVEGVSSEYTIPENIETGTHSVMVVVTDQQTPAKADTAEVVLQVEAMPTAACEGFDESQVNSGEGNIAITDFTLNNDNDRVQEFIINNSNDTGLLGEENPDGCGEVMMFDKTAGEWGGWNGFKIVLEEPFSVEEFQTFGRDGATKLVKVDIYRGEKSGSGAFPAEGLPMYINLGNNEKYGDHPVGRSQYLIGTLTKNNEWETVSFYFNPANSGDIDANVGDGETDMLEFLPTGGNIDDGGLYYFDNLRIENDPDAGGSPPGSVAETVCDYDMDEAALINAGWTKTFEDNFSGDLSKWDVWASGAYNNELQYYSPDNIEIVDGMLVITSKKETVTGTSQPGSSTSKTFDFTSGRMESKTKISANATSPKVRMMARIKWPSGEGMWPAFWSVGAAWPTNGEIDVLEARGHEPNLYHTNYFFGTEPGQNLVQNATGHITADDDLTSCFHLYELVWEENTLTSYLDGQVVEVKTSGGYIDDLFGKNHSLVLNLAVGGDYFNNLDPATIQPGIMYVDYVKVFTSN